MINRKEIKETALGGILNNPVFVLVLGTCPTIAKSDTISNGLGLGLATAFVLICSNVFISLLRKLIPDKVRLPAYIVIIATFVTIVQLFIAKFLPDLNASIGAFIPLIVVNCIILGRAEQRRVVRARRRINGFRLHTVAGAHGRAQTGLGRNRAHAVSGDGRRLYRVRTDDGSVQFRHGKSARTQVARVVRHGR